MTPIKYNILQEFKAEINSIEINNEKVYWILTRTVDELNKTLKNIDITKQNEFVIDFIDLVSDLYLDTYLNEYIITASIIQSLEDFILKGNNNLNNLKFVIYLYNGIADHYKLDQINEKLKNGYYTK